MDTDSLEKKLIETGYFGLFLHGNNSLAESIWQNGNNLTSLKQIIQTPTSSLHGKFLAAEMLRQFEVEFEPRQYEELVDAYLYALKNTSSDRNNPLGLNGNLWGLLNIEDDAGHLGQQIIKFGPAAIPALTELLDDHAGRILYEGSEEAVIGNSYRYRIKDFAAFYISKIKNIPMQFHQDLEKRDKEIERLKKLINQK
jgi:hypothetical protein